MENFNKEFNNAVDRLNTKFKEMKYSAEYLELKENMDEVSVTTKKLFKEDIGSAGKSVGKLIKKFLSNQNFTQLIEIKK